jgi:exo-beta-1,3-glucanase (GH17 family)
MIKQLLNLLFLVLVITSFNCTPTQKSKNSTEITAKDILGNPNYLAISYGGYRHGTRAKVPTVDEMKEDMKILSAMGIKILRTYNTQQFAHTANLLKAIRALKEEDKSFEMYVMLGVWIACEGAFSGNINHEKEDIKNNTAEIETAIKMINENPDIIKIIAVGNEAMINWAVGYFVRPNVILKWVKYLKGLRNEGKIPASTWITSSDNFESWGGGSKSYHTPDLESLIKEVDYISMHTYPFHDSHYNSGFWGVPKAQENLSKLEQIEAGMLRAKNYAIAQYQRVATYVNSIDAKKPIHIGETGWATIASGNYGATGSKAADEFKEKLYYKHMRDWTNEAGMSCFYFEAFNEPWKDAGHALGSENHFGLINVKGEAKYVLWDLVDKGTFKGLTRGGNPITKTYSGNEDKLMADVLAMPLISDIGYSEITDVNTTRNAGEPITEDKYIVVHESLRPNSNNQMTYPSFKLKLNAWEGTCGIKMTEAKVIEVATGTGAWWGCGLEIANGVSEDLSNFENGKLYFDIKGDTKSSFKIGFQTGNYAKGNQVNNFKVLEASNEWKSYAISIVDLNKGANLKDVTSLLFFLGDKNFDGKTIYIKNVYYSKN